MLRELGTFFQKHDSVSFVRYQWVDLLGILRERVLTKPHVLTLAEAGEDLSVGPDALYVSYVNEPDTTPRAGTSKLKPDWTSLRKCHYNLRYASVMCFIHEGVDNMEFSRDPRSKLAKTIRRASFDFGLTFLAGFELEFVLLKASNDAGKWDIFQNVSSWSCAAGLRNEAMPIIEEIALQLQSSDIAVEQFHTEGPQGMFEIVTGPLNPMEAVDTLVYTTETIKSISHSHGFKATFFPKAGSGPTGQHIHLSLQDTTNENHFLAGLLQHLPAVSAITLPNFDSYSRVQDFVGATGSWVSWGTELRDVPIRKIEPGRWEMRFVDGTANMYLGLASILEAGMLGLLNMSELTIKDAQQSPGKMTEEVRKDHDIIKRLPLTLKDAISALKEDEEFRESFGEKLCDKYEYHKSLEEEIQSRASEEDRKAVCIQYW